MACVHRSTEMPTFVIAALLAFGAAAAAAPLPKIPSSRRDFESWAAKHNRHYPSAVAADVRFAHFQKNAEAVSKVSATAPLARYAMDEFGDWLPEEFVRHNAIASQSFCVAWVCPSAAKSSCSSRCFRVQAAHRPLDEFRPAFADKEVETQERFSAAKVAAAVAAGPIDWVEKGADH